MAATQLSIYNAALLLCEERQLAGAAGVPTENRKPRYLLDSVWDNGGVRACLEEGFWTFACRTIAAEFDPNIQPAYGYIHAFQKPITDYIRSAAVSSDPYFNAPFTQYADEAGYWWADIDTLYVKYISDDPNYGLNMNRWSESFRQFVEAYFASKVVKDLTHDKGIQDRVMMELKRQRNSARGKDSMNEPAKFFQKGQLVRARQGSYFGRPGGSGQGWE